MVGETTDGLDNGILVPDSESVISSIKYHAKFTPSFSLEKFDLPKAYYATAESIRDMLITNWNATYNFHKKMNVKQAYYLSMEFFQGRALLNVIGNLELSGAYAEALRKPGHDLEDVAKEETDLMIVDLNDDLRISIGVNRLRLGLQYQHKSSEELNDELRFSVAANRVRN
ncbi:unnamed protein product [Lactuca saligna]|uniref:Glycogen phosphorylase n=1 Tax=Lactuca saligna TaxID=75948 RepID=A0AA35Y4V9_LACSI|nr:unnamed protein product [Lactuca saligna]